MCKTLAFHRLLLERRSRITVFVLSSGERRLVQDSLSHSCEVHHGVEVGVVCNDAQLCETICNNGSWCHPWLTFSTHHQLESEGETRPVSCRVLRRDIPVVNFRPGPCTAEDRACGMGCVGQTKLDIVCLAVSSNRVVDHVLHTCSVHEGT